MGTYYVMGGEYQSRGDQFLLVKPGKGLPYVTENPNGTLVRLCKHHSHVYRLSDDRRTAHLVKDYLIDDVGHPEMAELSDADYEGVCKRIEAGDIYE